MTTEFGVRYCVDGESWVSPGFTRAGARRLVATLSAGKQSVQRPTPTTVMRREIGPWVEEETP